MPWTKCATINVRRANLVTVVFLTLAAVGDAAIVMAVKAFSLHPAMALIGITTCSLSEITLFRFIRDSHDRYLYGFSDEDEFKVDPAEIIKNRQ